MNFGELLFLAFLGLLVFGPRKLPEIARTVAKLMAELRRASNEFRYTLEEEIRAAEVHEQEQKRIAAASQDAPAPEAASGLEGTVPAPVPGSIARES
ncbi:MAG TPA: Sec-independent protein translocase protein TatB [Terriglobales bacterium]|nr:Sec-independent protein translocase protein TatB [Terriglobales bacterium]